VNYLVDTSVLSEPRQKRPESKVVNWLKANEASLYTSVLVTGEIRYSIERLPANSAWRAELLVWYERLLSIMAGRDAGGRQHARPHHKQFLAHLSSALRRAAHKVALPSPTSCG
jgi:predicted nucleic acid-binding protein